MILKQLNSHSNPLHRHYHSSHWSHKLTSECSNLSLSNSRTNLAIWTLPPLLTVSGRIISFSMPSITILYFSHRIIDTGTPGRGCVTGDENSRPGIVLGLPLRSDFFSNAWLTVCALWLQGPRPITCQPEAVSMWTVDLRGFPTHPVSHEQPVLPICSRGHSSGPAEPRTHQQRLSLPKLHIRMAD